MAKNEIGQAPFSPVRLIDQDAPLTLAQLTKVLSTATDGVSLCIRYGSGPANRGGYFFHVKRSGAGNKWTLLDFERHEIASVSLDFLCRFINHCSGREFDYECLDFARNTINLRTD